MAFMQWEASLDPGDSKDYKVDYTTEMTATSDILVTSDFVPSLEAAAAGLEVVSQEHDTTTGTAYFRVATDKRDSPQWQDGGTVLTVIHTVTTQDGRTLRRTLELLVQVR